MADSMLLLRLFFVASNKVFVVFVGVVVLYVYFFN